MKIKNKGNGGRFETQAVLEERSASMFPTGHLIAQNCPICGKRRGQNLKHDSCSKQLQKKYAGEHA